MAGQKVAFSNCCSILFSSGVPDLQLMHMLELHGHHEQRCCRRHYGRTVAEAVENHSRVGRTFVRSVSQKGNQHLI